MKELTRKALLAASPVFGACIGIAVLQAAHLPFPLTLTGDAWPQWIVFVSLVHTFTALCMFVTGRAFGEAPTSGPRMSQPNA